MSDELIVKLNELRRAFSDKGSTSNTGKLYNAFKKKLTAANKAVTEGTRVTKQVVKNVKVVDAYTDTSIVEANPPFYDDVIDLTFNYGVVDEDIGHIHGPDPTEFVGAPALSLTKHLGTAFPTADTDDRSYCTYGWIFFDYDKALYESSVLAQYANMEIILDMIGRDMLNKYFYVKSARYEEYYHYESDGTTIGKPYLLPSEDYTTGWEWDSQMNTQLKATILNGYKTEATSQRTERSLQGYPYVVDVLGNKAYSFVLLRNFQVARDGGNDGYRIMGFEIQSWSAGGSLGYESTEAETSSPDIWFIVGVTDNTAALIDDLIALYTTAQTEFQTYIDDSVGGYGWNDLTNTFSDAFVAEQEALYEGSEELAPWNLIPWYYFLFVELLSGTFNGDLDAISAAASAISSEVAPASGTKDLILAFQEKLDGLYDDYLSPGTKWGEASANATTQDKNKEYSNTWSYSSLFPISTYSSGGSAFGCLDPYEYPIDQFLDSTTAYAKSADDTVVSVTKAEVWMAGLHPDDTLGYEWLDTSDTDTNLGQLSHTADNIWSTAVDAYEPSTSPGQNATAFRIYFDGPLYYYVDNSDAGDGTGFEITALEDGKTFAYTGWANAVGPDLPLTNDGAIAVESQYFSVAINSNTTPTGPSWYDASEYWANLGWGDEELGIEATYNGDASAGDTGEYYFEIIINGGLWPEGMDWTSSGTTVYPWQAALIFNPDPRGYWATRSELAADDASAKANYAGWELDFGGRSTMLVNAAGEQLNLGVLDSYDIPIEPATSWGDTTNAVQIEWTFGDVTPTGGNIELLDLDVDFGDMTGGFGPSF